MTPITPMTAGRSVMSRYAKPPHKSVAWMVGYALTLGDADGYLALADVMALRLTKVERTGLAYASLMALDDDHAYRTVSLALSGTLNGEAV